MSGSGLDLPAQLLHLVRLLPLVFVHEEGLGQLPVDIAVEKVEPLDHARRREVEDLRDDLFQLPVGDLPRAEGVHVDREGPRHPDGVGELDGALFGEPRGDNVFRRVAGAESGRAVHLFGGLVHDAPTAELRAGEAAVELNDELAARDAGVGSAAGVYGLPLARGIEEEFRLAVDPVPEHIEAHFLRGGLDILSPALADVTVVHGVGHEDLDHAQRPARLVVVLDADLALSVRCKVGVLRLLEGPHHPVAQDVGKGQELRGV